MDENKFKDGAPLDLGDVVDCHCHVGPCRDFDVSEWDEESIRGSMDRLGISRSIISSNLSLGADFIEGNEETLRIVEQHPDRFAGYITVNPNYPAESEKEIKKYGNSKHMVAIKMHPTFHDYPIDGDNYAPVFSYANERRMAVLCHTWGSAHIRAIRKKASSYPNAFIIIGHSGGTIQAVKDAIKAAEEHPNLFLDLACSLQYDKVIELMCDSVGSRQVLFGTDAPYVDPKSSIGRIFYAEITEEDKRNILGKNILGILSRLED